MADWVTGIGEQAIAGIIAGVVVAILLASAPRIRQWFEKSWVGGAIAGVIAVFVLSAFIQGPQGEQGPAGTAVPEMVAAFAATQCPEGWMPFEAAEGRFIVGNDGRDEWRVEIIGDQLVFEDGGQEEVTLTIEQMPTHNHITRDADFARFPSAEFARHAPENTGSFMGSDTSGFGLDLSPQASAGADRPHPNMPPYIALYWCTPVTGEAE